MEWNFPVTPGTPITVRLYFANQYSGTSTPGTRVFDVSLDGTEVLTDEDLVALHGHQVGFLSP
ncbi:MAG: malectin domain-containing carbohydrate-binding protein [Nocardioides sp.]